VNSRSVDLYWLERHPNASEALSVISKSPEPTLDALHGVVGKYLDFLQVNRADKLLQRILAGSPPPAVGSKPLRFAILSTSTADHLLPAIRVAGWRRSQIIETHTGEYGQYLQELENPHSDVIKFKPDVMLLVFHAQHLIGNSALTLTHQEADAYVESILERIRTVWRLAKSRFQGQLIQQTIIPTYLPLVGSNEQRLPGSPMRLVARINHALGALADAEGVDLFTIDAQIARDGIDAWHDTALWHRAKQEISPRAAPAYADHLLRLVMAQRGRSAKCLVLDLDNTLWGGVIGDDGLEGIKLGQGSAIGEAYIAFQSFVRDLSRRGIILAVCSKNDVANARLPFEQHPEMLLKLTDIACFIANWDDKATNIRQIAAQLNIGLDSLVFVDDNPFERNIVRRELPMIAVPELPEEPALYGQCIADAGYFEALQVTSDDFQRNGQYLANAERDRLRASHTDLKGYLKSLEMELRWQAFDAVGLQRIVQLINKTNQFNLTTRRYTEAEVQAIIDEPRALTLQIRLLDKFGDNGIIGIVIGLPEADALRLDTWLMSCRVLGRQVEEATMNLVVERARSMGVRRLIGEYIPTKKNGMVKEHYRKLGFLPLDNVADTLADGATTWEHRIDSYTPFETSISTVQGMTHG